MIRPQQRLGGENGLPRESMRRRPRWLAVLAGLSGTLLGTATNLYSAEFRDALSLDPPMVYRGRSLGLFGRTVELSAARGQG